MADRFSRFNEDRDFQVNTGVAEDHPRPWRARREPGAASLPGLPTLLPSALRSALQAGSFSFLPLISPGASRAEMRPRPRLHPYSRRLLDSGFLPFCPRLPAPQPGALWGLRFACLGACAGAGPAPGGEGWGGEALGQRFSCPGYGSLGFCSPRSSWESSLRFPIVINKPFIVCLT